MAGLSVELDWRSHDVPVNVNPARQVQLRRRASATTAKRSTVQYILIYRPSSLGDCYPALGPSIPIDILVWQYEKYRTHICKQAVVPLVMASIALLCPH